MSEIISVSASSDMGIARTSLKSLKFIIISYLISVILLAVLAVVIVYTDVSESISVPAVKSIKLFAAFLSAFLTSRSCNSKGWLCGIITGTINVALLIFIGTLLVDGSFFKKSNILLVAFGGICGMIGGIIGVNSGKK